MARDWDETLKQWAKTIDANDEKRGSAASDAIEAAIRAAPPFANKGKALEVFVTGSYRNQTNIRKDSDVDVAVVLHDSLFYVLPSDGSLTKEMVGIRDSDYTFDAFRNHVGDALRARFGNAGVTPGNKAFNVPASGDRLEADVAVFFEHRRYTGKKTEANEWERHLGAELCPRNPSSARIINWPEQHQKRGEKKNDATNGRFKRMVRIFKHLAADMAVQGTVKQQSAAGQASSFFLECLVYNAPDTCFNQQDGGWLKDVKDVLEWLVRTTRHGAPAPKLVEVSGLEWLFRDATGRTPHQAYTFSQAGHERIFGKEIP